MFHDLFWALYWIDVLSRIVPSLVVGTLVGSIVSVFPSAFLHDCVNTAHAGRWGWSVFVSILVGAILIAFVPSKQTMYMMLGVRATENIVESPIGKKLQSVLDAQIDEYFSKFQKK
jgi:hypothetical protein